MGLAAIVSICSAFGVAMLLGGDARAAGFAAAAVAAASLASFLPVIIQSRSGAAVFGMLIFGASIARIFLLMIAVLAIDNAGTVERRPFVLGVLVGAAVTLIIETASAVIILKKLERAGAHRTGTNANHSEHV
jgi:Kef-type K+ transport system membrane component KefB